MIYFLNILFCLAVSILYDANRKNKFIILFLIFFISLLPSLRSINIGTDTYNYVRMFHEFSAANNISDLFLFNTEKGYVFFNYFSSFFVDSFNGFFFIFYLTIFSLYITFFLKNSNLFSLSLLVFMVLGFYAASFNIMRQIMALSICLFSLKYVFKQDFIKFILIIMLSSLFHITSLIFIIVYFIYKFQNYYKYILLTFILLVVVVFKFYLFFILEFLNMSVGYAESSENSGGGATLILYTIMLLYFYWLSRGFYDKQYQFYLNVFALCVSLIFIFFVFKVPLAGPMRLILYFAWSLCMLFPLSLSYYRKGVSRNLILVLYIIVLLVYGWQANFIGSLGDYEFEVRL